MPPFEYDYEEYWKNRIDVNHPEDDLTYQRVKLIFPLLQENARILDVGCGNGDAATYFQDRNIRYEGIDISPTAIESAKTRFPKYSFQTLSNEQHKFPYPDEYFDAVFCTEVIEHIYAVNSFLNECNRIMKAGGLALFSTPYHGLIKNLAIIMTGFEKHFNPEGQHIRFFTPQSLQAILEHSNFTVISKIYFGRIRPLSKNMVFIAQKPGF